MSSDVDKDFAQINKLMPLASMQELQEFLACFAREHDDFRTAWRDWLRQRFLPTGTTEEEVRASVSAVFKATPLLERSRRYWNDDCLNWSELGESMLNLLQALPESPPATRLATAIEFLRQLGRYNDDEALMDEGWCDVEEAVNLAQEYISDYVGRDDVSAADKQAVVEDMKRTIQLPLYVDADVFDMDRLLLELRLSLQNGDEALKMLDAEISRADNYRKPDLIRRKCSLLRKLHRGAEVEPLLQGFRHLDDIRRDLVELLMQDGRYEQGMRLLDEAIRESPDDRHWLANSWRELQCSYAEKHRDTERLLPLCRDIFIERQGCPEYYRKLKKLIPADEWRDYLDGLLKYLMTRKRYRSDYLADIFLSENQQQRVVEVMPGDYDARLRFICCYAPKVKDAAPMLTPFAEAAREHARRNMSRGFYRELAGFLDKIIPLPGGRECVQALVSEFRDIYRRRPAMMDELKRF